LGLPFIKFAFLELSPNLAKAINYLKRKAQKEGKEFNLPPAASEALGHLI